MTKTADDELWWTGGGSAVRLVSNMIVCAHTIMLPATEFPAQENPQPGIQNKNKNRYNIHEAHIGFTYGRMQWV